VYREVLAYGQDVVVCDVGAAIKVLKSIAMLRIAVFANGLPRSIYAAV